LKARRLGRQRKTHIWRAARYAVVLFACLATGALLVSGAGAVSGAANTTDNAGFVGPGSYSNLNCLNGNGPSPRVNCNIYQDKRDVWINGGPTNGQSNLSDGYYFFAVLSPGGQPNPNDGAPLKPNGNDPNLSDNFDTAANRVFHVTNGQVGSCTPDPGISGAAAHSCSNTYQATDGLLLQLFPYADTPNPGGVYILASCFLSADDPDVHTVDPKDCKYDAFKVVTGSECTQDCGPPPADDLAVEKDAAASFSRQFKWTVVKTVDGVHGVSYNAATKTLSYHVVYTKSLDSEFGFEVHGTITVTNANSFDVTGVKVADVLNDAAPTQCTVQDGTYTDGFGNQQSVSNGASGGAIPSLTVVEYAYSCSPSDTTATLNTATVSWDASNGLPDTSKDGSAAVTWPSPTLIHNCVTASDTIPAGGIVGTPPTGSICASTTFDYTKTVTIANACTTVNNTAAFADGNYTGSDSTTAQICGPVTGGLTMGFWQNNNGQKIIKAGTSTSNVCNSGTWLRQFQPFQDLSSTANCNTVAIYVYNVIKGGGINCGQTNCNALLKAQMLATALNVYFSTPGLGGNQIGAPTPLGGVNVNITAYKVAFNNQTCLTVMAMLIYAGNQSNSGGSSWYGQVKATQERAKSAFDAINNQVAFSC
jgi:hypothetical protein